ncbi:hypothetical protein FOZ60_000788 [Perkinsus olseni]|uniref:Integrase catalytic domain-containing protein n=1 Tax=Perkinsus olseni TaxID=32597 RepID=A0A7J6MWK8_PEROL|nr:hypothetical protein FOZ60_000788 [Perkinsus olseni]
MSVNEASEHTSLCPTFRGLPESDRGDTGKSLEIFLRRFETYLEIKGVIPPVDVNDAEARQRYQHKRVGLLKAALKDQAAALVYSLPPEAQSDYELVTQALRTAYGLDCLEAYNRFKSRKMTAAENVDSYIALLRHDLACCLPTVTREAILKLQLLSGLPSGSTAKVQALARESPTTTLEQLTVTIRDQLRASRLDEAGIQASALVGPIAAKGKGKGKGRYGKGKGRMGKGVMNPDYSQVICYDFTVDAVIVDRIPGGFNVLIGYDYFRESAARITLSVDSSTGMPQTLLSALGPPVAQCVEKNHYKLPSCDVVEERLGSKVVSVTLEAPDCWARREPVFDDEHNKEETYRWVVGWKWKPRDDEVISGPSYVPGPQELPNLLNKLSEKEYADLVAELRSWVDRGWLVPVADDEKHKVRAILPVIPVLTPHRSTKARPTLNFQKINSYSVKAVDPAAASCPDSLRVWRQFQEGLVVDISKAYPSLYLSEPLTWYQCLYLRLDGRDKPGCLFRLRRLGFGHSSSPRILKCVLDYILGPDAVESVQPSDLPSLSVEGSLLRTGPVSAEFSRDAVPKHYKYFDDILVPVQHVAEREQARKNVDVIRSLLQSNNLYTKPPSFLDGSRLLGLEVRRSAGGQLYWKRRVSLATLLEIEHKLIEDPTSLTAKDISSWLGSLASHLPVLRWLRPTVAIGKRLLGRSIGSDYSRWNESPAPNIISYCSHICKELRSRGDPARGRWQLPPVTEQVWCYVECSDIAIGVTLTTPRNEVLFDTTALRTPDKDSIRATTHINCGELEACILGIEMLVRFNYTNAIIYCDSTAATKWLQALIDKQKIHVSGIYKLLITRRLSLLRSLLAQYPLSLKVCQVRSQNNLADVVTRVCFNFDAYVTKTANSDLLAFTPRLGGEVEEKKWWPSPNEIQEAQGDDKLQYYGGLPILPVSLHRNVILKLHNFMLHAGEKAVREVVKRYYYVPNLTLAIHEALQYCDDERCVRERAKKTIIDTTSPRRLATTIWSTVAADVTYIDGRGCLIAVDEYSRFASGRPVQSEASNWLWKALCSIFNDPLLGWPVYLRCDRGAGFLGLKHRLRERGVVLVATSGHRPTANACVERLNGTIKAKMMYLPTTMSLSDKLQQCIEVYNNTPHSSTKKTPVEVLLGRQPRIGAEQPEPVPTSEGQAPFEVGQLVWVLKPPNERRAGNRYMPSKYRVVASSSHASVVIQVNAVNSKEINVTNDRIVPAQGSEVPDNMVEDVEGSVCSEVLTISSQRSTPVSVRNDQEAELMEDDNVLPQADPHPPEAILPAAPSSPRPVRHRHEPSRFEPGGDPKETSFDSKGYPIS